MVEVETTLKPGDLLDRVREIEQEHGRVRLERWGSRTLDIDILTYGDLSGVHADIVLPREEVAENAYVLWPLAQVLGEQVHQPSGRTYAQLWNAYDKSRQRLQPVEFIWQGRQVSAHF